MNPDNQAPPKPSSSTTNPKQQAIDRLKQAENVLVTVSSNPSVDQLAACIGLTLMLNKLGKHGTAVYSGATPSTIEFLKPEETLEKNTDSLRDFIIALDKSKADKLRYKVEDKIVQIFITPYRTSLSEKDLDFSLGDFNVDAVVALGVHKQEELDQAITAHGRILHDATIISVNTTPNNDLGSVNWQDGKTSSLSEMVAALGNGLGKNVFDTQIATALLTGIVAATDRFSNDKTFSDTMSISAQLIAAGANQQLVATKLEEAEPKAPPEPVAPPVPAPAPVEQLAPPAVAKPVSAPPEPPKVEPKKPDDGTLLISHSQNPSDANQKAAEEEEREVTSLDDLNLGEEDKDETEPISQIDIDNEGTLRAVDEKEAANVMSTASGIRTLQPLQPSPGPGAANANFNITGGTPMMQSPPTLPGGTLTANSQAQGLDPSTDPLSLPPVDTPLLKRDGPTDLGLVANPSSIQPLGMAMPPNQGPSLPPIAPMPGNGPLPDLDSVRRAVEQVADNPAGQLKPLEGLNAQPVFENLHQPPANPGAPPAPGLPEVGGHSILSMPVPPASAIGGQTNQGEDAPSGAPQPNPAATDTDAPPTVPPPMTDISNSSFL